MKTVLRRADEKNLAISIDKCKSACIQIEWLGHIVDNEGIYPLITKTEAIES